MPTAWRSWISDTGTTTSTATTWYAWVGGTNSATTITNATWSDWNTAYITVSAATPYVMPPETDAQREAREERTRQYAIEQERLKQERAEADARAEALLLEELSAAQQAEYQQSQSFTVLSADGERTYRIGKGWSGNVRLVGPNGEIRRRYCIHPSEQVPLQDNMLAQKLLIEADEPTFLRVANAS